MFCFQSALFGFRGGFREQLAQRLHPVPGFGIVRVKSFAEGAIR
jgi:hypothetical protein